MRRSSSMAAKKKGCPACLSRTGNFEPANSKAVKRRSRPALIKSSEKGIESTQPTASFIASVRRSNSLCNNFSNSAPSCSANPKHGMLAAHFRLLGSQRPGEHKPKPSANSCLFPRSLKASGGPSPHRPAPFFGFTTPSSSSSELTS